jgi:hypothetical protein
MAKISGEREHVRSDISSGFRSAFQRPDRKSVPKKIQTFGFYELSKPK